jgi:DnaJ-class molecular chaperone
MDYYTTLGVNKNASPDEIKKAYRKMAGIHHPDKGGNTAEFQKIQSAYEILSDPNKRQQYDTPQPQGFPGGFHFSGGFNVNDIFSQMFGGHPGQGPFGHRPQPNIYKTEVWVTLEEVFQGVEKVMQFNNHHGSHTVKIQVPKGVENGAQLRYDNMIRDANLIVEFKIYPHSKFERQGLNLVSTVSISVLDLIVGTTLTFTTIGGKILEVNVLPKTQPDSHLKLSKQGLVNNSLIGDQIILLKPFIPDIIDQDIINSITRRNLNVN